MSDSQIIEADLTWIDGAFLPGVRVAVANGVITEVGALDAAPTRRLSGRALLPGYVNAHSHAFQRGLRGLGEHFPAGSGSFWTWREAMYDLVASMDEERLTALCVGAFEEMLAAGMTTVGEFHYLHHDATGAGFRFDEVVLAAAARAGIRIVLLNAVYAMGGFDSPLTGGQKRFATPDLDAYWTQMERLGEIVDGDLARLGAVAHSLRAVSIEDIARIREEAERRHLVMHLHLEEQPQEIKDCVDRHGKTPMALLNEQVDIGPTLTAVHCTHSAAADLEEYLDRGGNVCLCPLTEANLGDGIADVPRMLKRPGQLALGSDSNARIDMLEEMRLLEYGQRLRGQHRGVCLDASGRVGACLLEAATHGGARALGLRTGAIRPTHLADLQSIDLQHPQLAGSTAETLADALVLGAGSRVITEVCVGGVWRPIGAP